MFGEKGGRGIQHAADAAIEREFAAANRVDRYAGRVRRIFDGKFDIDLHRHIPEEPAFCADKGNLIIKLPRHVIARADVDIFVGQAFADHRLHGFSLGNLFRGQPGAIQHV